MSLSLKQKLISRIDKIRKRQSFDERICDDLSQVILQYLSLKDKFKLECVSKQFQRTIFQKEYEYSINTYYDFMGEYHYTFWRQQEIYFTDYFDEIESVLKKCPNIQYLDIVSDYFDESDNYYEYNLLIDLIIKYCNNLTKIDCHLDSMSDQMMQKLIEKFGSKLMYLGFDFIYETKFENIWQCFPNIEDLKLSGSNLSHVCKVQFKHLKKFRFDFITENIFDFQIFVDNNPKIEILTAFIRIEDPIEVNFVLNQISRLKNLVKLKIQGFGAKFYLNQKSFSKSIRRIALNCPKLKSIGCDIIIDFDNYQQINEILWPLKAFKQLKRLDLQINLIEDIHIENYQMFSCKAFKGFEDLTYLSIYSNCNKYDTILTDIDINLPKLKYLNIKNAINATDWTHIVLCRLSSLETIKLNIYDQNMAEIIETKLTEHKKFKIIKLFDYY